MAATQVWVRVLHGAAVVEDGLRRPVRLTPDGASGVVYAGAVYPLHVENVIDLAGPSWEVADCNRFLLAGSEVPYALRANQTAISAFRGLAGDWSVESSEFGHYVVFNAPERLAADAVDALESSGLLVQRWDVSYRPSSDGKFYDWFARLRFKGSHEETVARVAAVFTPTESEASETAEPPVASSSIQLEQLESEVERLLELTADLTARLGSSETEVDRLRARLTLAVEREAESVDKLERSLGHQRSLRSQILELSRAPEREAESQALLEKQVDTEALLELALAENAILRAGLAEVEARAEQGESKIRSLENSLSVLQDRLQELSEQDRERRRLVTTRVAPRRGVPGFLDTVFARLTFVLDSVEVLANLDAPTAVMRSLVLIDMGESVGKDLEGLLGWREVSKLATGIAGSEAMGRIYYKPDGDRVLVSVHIKQDDKEQRRHIERLRSVSS